VALDQLAGVGVGDEMHALAAFLVGLGRILVLHFRLTDLAGPAEGSRARRGGWFFRHTGGLLFLFAAPRHGRAKRDTTGRHKPQQIPALGITGFHYSIHFYIFI